MEESKCKLSPAIEELVREVKQELERQQTQSPSRVPALEAELASATSQIEGYTMSLGKPNLAPEMREHVENAMADALRRKQELQFELEWERRAREHVDQVVDEEKIKAALSRLDKLLAGENVSLANIELALHIDRIQCFDDARVRIRMCRLGALPAATKLLDSPDAPYPADGAKGQVKPRRRSRRSTSGADYGDREIKELAVFSSDVNRYAGLDDKWFTVDEFKMTKKTSWVEENADRVFEYREKELAGVRNKTKRLEERFAKSKPTILKALRIAEERRKQMQPAGDGGNQHAGKKPSENTGEQPGPESTKPDEAA